MLPYRPVPVCWLVIVNVAYPPFIIHPTPTTALAQAANQAGTVTIAWQFFIVRRIVQYVVHDLPPRRVYAQDFFERADNIVRVVRSHAGE